MAEKNKKKVQIFGVALVMLIVAAVFLPQVIHAFYYCCIQTLTGSTSSITSTSATVQGITDSVTGKVDVWFEYGPNGCSGSPMYTTPMQTLTMTPYVQTYFSATLTGLTPNTTYYYCAVAVDVPPTSGDLGSTSTGSQSQFTTVNGPVFIGGSQMVTNITSSQATIGFNSSINPHWDTIVDSNWGTGTMVWYQWGPTTAYGTDSSASPQAPGTGDSANPTSGAPVYTITGLSPNTTYHVRAVGYNSGGNIGYGYGADTTFTTLPNVTLTASPSSIVSGGSSTLTWTSTATSCTASLPAGWTSSTAANGSATVSPTSSTNYYITCTISGVSNSAVALVTVIPPPTVTMSASPNPIAAGSSSVITWNSSNATSCAAGTPTGWTSSTAVSGTQAVTPAVTTVYNLSCTGPAGTTAQSVTVTVAPPPTVTTSAATGITSTGATLNGSANPNGYGATGWFRYWTTNPGTCSDTGGTRAPASGGTSLGAGTSPVAYSRSITGLAAGTTYYFCAIAAGTGGTGFGSVMSFPTAPPTAPTVSLSASPTSVVSGGSSIVSWTSTSATSCSATSPVGWTASTATAGSQTVTPSGTTTYLMSCTGPGGTSSGSVSVTVSAAAPTVSGISPASGVNTASVTLTSVTGANFQSGAIVQLKQGTTVLNCTGVAFTDAATLSGGSCPITGAATGLWDVVVTNPDMQQGTLTSGFTVTAPVAYTISVTIAGTGTGIVTSSPAGISCPNTCTASAFSGTVTLTAAPSGSSTFGGFSGCTVTGTYTCTVNAAATVSATFNAPSGPISYAVTQSGLTDFQGWAWGDDVMGWISFNSANCDTNGDGIWDACGLTGTAHPYKVYVVGTLPCSPPTASAIQSNFTDRCAGPFNPTLSFVYKDNQLNPLLQYTVTVYDNTTTPTAVDTFTVRYCDSDKNGYVDTNIMTAGCGGDNASTAFGSPPAPVSPLTTMPLIYNGGTPPTPSSAGITVMYNYPYTGSTYQLQYGHSYYYTVTVQSVCNLN